MKLLTRFCRWITDKTEKSGLKPIQIGGYKVYRLEDIAKGIRINLETLKKEIKDGKLKAVKRGNRWFVKEVELRKYLVGNSESEVSSVINEEFSRDLDLL